MGANFYRLEQKEINKSHWVFTIYNIGLKTSLPESEKLKKFEKSVKQSQNVLKMGKYSKKIFAVIAAQYVTMLVRQSVCKSANQQQLLGSVLK